jgi:GWxTD domain-containing protein
MKRPIQQLAATLLAVALAAGVCGAQSGGFGSGYGDPASIGGIRFAADVSAVPQGEGPGTVEIEYTVSYDELIFLRHEEGYRARYEVTAILYDDHGRQVAGDSWRRSAEVETYAETNSRRERRREILTLSALPGKYRLRLELASLDTRSFGLMEREIVMPALTPGGLTLGTITFQRRIAGESSPGDYEPNPMREFGQAYPDARVSIPVYGNSGTSYTIELAILAQTGERVLTHEEELVQTEFMGEYHYDFSALELDVGLYQLRAKLVPESGDDQNGRARFRVITSPLSWGGDHEKMLAQISIIASRDEYDLLADTAPEELDQAWEEFWRSRDPDPDTEENEFRVEFLRRLAYANLNFRSIVEGWQTDMGRVFLQYGQPDDIDSTPVGKMLNAWEVWYYYGHHTKYIFVDTDGFGEFKLVEESGI